MRQRKGVSEGGTSLKSCYPPQEKEGSSELTEPIERDPASPWQREKCWHYSPPELYHSSWEDWLSQHVRDEKYFHFNWVSLNCLSTKHQQYIGIYTWVHCNKSIIYKHTIHLAPTLMPKLFRISNDKKKNSSAAKNQLKSSDKIHRLLTSPYNQHVWIPVEQIGFQTSSKCVQLLFHTNVLGERITQLWSCGDTPNAWNLTPLPLGTVKSPESADQVVLIGICHDTSSVK